MIDQRTDAWKSQRSGMLTASNFPKLMTNGRGSTKMGKTAMSYIKEVATEVITGISREFTSAATDWGIDHEQEAFEAVIAEVMPFEACGFYTYKGEDDLLRGYVGGTPDGINETHVLEIKCPYDPTKHLDRIIDVTELINDYKFQVIGEMIVTGKDRAILASYHPNFEHDKLVHVELFLEDMADEYTLLMHRLKESVVELKGLLAKYQKLNEALAQ